MTTSDNSTTSPILHVDMDAFFASVELRERPHLRDRPVIIGGLGNRSVVVSATYPARALGVRAAMPMSQAMRLAPGANVIPPRSELYHDVSRNVMAIFESITAVVEPISVDEAFLDVSGAMKRLGTPLQIAQQIRAQVHAEQQITCSVGAAATKFVAKIASDRCKPDGLLVVPAAATLEFLQPLPVEALWGVGAKTATALHRLGVKTVADVSTLGKATLLKAVGAAHGEHLWALAHGVDPRPVQAGAPERSVGAEVTFAEDLCDEKVLFGEFLRLSDRVATSLRTQGVVASTVTLKVRYGDFQTITRSKTMTSPTDVSRELYRIVRLLWQKERHRSPWIRLVGVRCENLHNASTTDFQPMLGDPEHGWREAEAAMDAARTKFGKNSLTSATLLGQENPRISRDSQHQK